VSFKIIMTASVTRPCFTTQHQTSKTKTTVCKTKTTAYTRPTPICLVSDRCCPKTDGLRPHHWHRRTWLPVLTKFEVPTEQARISRRATLR